MKSLHSFAQETGIPKTTLKRWLNDNGHNTSNGLSPEAIAAAKAHFRIEEAQPQPAAVATLPTITTGNHRGELALPQQPTAIDLGAYRGENAALSSFEPEDIERFLSACDGFLEAVDADYQHQLTLTQQKEAAAAKVRAKVEQVKQAQVIYQVRSEALSLHNRGLDTELRDGLATLGKPAA